MPRHDPSEKTKSEILKTAAKLFEEKGWDKVNIDEIVKEVGVTRGAFYHYFKSREDLIYSVIVQSLMDDNPFEIVSKEKGLNALKKLRLALKLCFKPQLNVAIKSNMLKAMHDPLVFKSNVFFSVNVQAPYLEKLFIEGNEDGSMSVQYPKHMAQAAALIFDEWTNPAIFKMTEQEFSERLLFLEHFGERLGVPVVDDEIKEMLLQCYNSCCSKN